MSETLQEQHKRLMLTDASYRFGYDTGSAEVERLREALWAQGRDDGDGWHSWYCWSLTHSGRCTTSCEQARAVLEKQGGEST